MMVSLDDLMRKYRLNVTGVVHCGAHLAEEAADYHKHGFQPVWWIEANSDLIPRIQRAVRRYGGHVIQALLYDEDGVDLGFNITNMDGMSSSILEWGDHIVKAPSCVFVERKTLTTSTLDTLADEHHIQANLLIMDLQGVELRVLQGAERFLKTVDYVYSEVNVEELYEGCCMLWDLDAWLADRGFLRVETCMAEGHVYWGDGLWIRKP